MRITKERSSRLSHKHLKKNYPYVPSLYIDQPICAYNNYSYIIFIIPNPARERVSLTGVVSSSGMPGLIRYLLSGQTKNKVAWLCAEHKFTSSGVVKCWLRF